VGGILSHLKHTERRSEDGHAGRWLPIMNMPSVQKSMSASAILPSAMMDVFVFVFMVELTYGHWMAVVSREYARG
jgi:hypothetical protein